MRLGLVPERRGGDIILEREVAAARAPAESLDHDLQVLLEADRVHDVPAVESEALLDAVMAVSADDLGQAAVGRAELCIADNAVRARSIEVI